jgi:predicted transcriptional regulator
MENEHSIVNKNVLNETAVSTRVSSRKKGVSAYSKNPFWKPTEVKVGTRKVTISGGFVASNATGEGMHHAGIHRIEHVDESRFIKLFTDNLKVFFDLSSASQKVLHCVLAELQKHPDADGIWLPWFTVEDFALEKTIKISRTSFQRAMKEMLEKGFIAESENQNFYWINPNLFFNGDRMVFISEYRKTKKPDLKSVGTTK